MSASKMREHAASGNEKEFHKGAPSTMSSANKKAMYKDVRKGMGIDEGLISYKSLVEGNDSFEQSEDHKVHAEMAKGEGRIGAYHAHMVQHHELRGHWHASKGRHDAADREYDKAEHHHNESLKHPFNEEVNLKEGGFTAGWRDETHFGKGVPTNRPMTDKEKAEHEKMKQLQKSLDDMGKSDLKKEEVEQIDELSKDTLQSYFDKSIQRRSEIRKQHRTGQMSDADWQKERSKRAKGTRTALRKLYPEETYADDKAAAPSVMAPGEGISEKMTTAKRVMALKKKMVKEDLYDHEKEDKSVKTYGKKPSFDKADKDDSLGEKKPQAAAVLSGGTTLTGSKRDTIEIDPMMRNRPGQPDVTKKDDKDKDKKKDK